MCVMSMPVPVGQGFRGGCGVEMCSCAAALASLSFLLLRFTALLEDKCFPWKGVWLQPLIRHNKRKEWRFQYYWSWWPGWPSQVIFSPTLSWIQDYLFNKSAFLFCCQWFHSCDYEWNNLTFHFDGNTGLNIAEDAERPVWGGVF